MGSNKGTAPIHPAFCAHHPFSTSPPLLRSLQGPQRNENIAVETLSTHLLSANSLRAVAFWRPEVSAELSDEHQRLLSLHHLLWKTHSTLPYPDRSKSPTFPCACGHGYEQSAKFGFVTATTADSCLNQRSCEIGASFPLDHLAYSYYLLSPRWP